MRAVIHHGDNRTCPAVTQDGATHCPGHTVNVPEYTEDQFRAAILTAVEFGYKAAERGDNLQKCLEDAGTFLK